MSKHNDGQKQPPKETRPQPSRPQPDPSIISIVRKGEDRPITPRPASPQIEQIRKK